MSLFDIREIGSEIEAAAGVLDGCDLCGHCMVLRRSLASPRASTFSDREAATPAVPGAEGARAVNTGAQS
jgi:hypothetical protein